MKKEKCIICSIAKGKRVCMLHDNALICPICCAKTRIPECEGCIYYEQAGQFGKEKIKIERSRRFIIEINPELEEKVDEALAMAEKGRIVSSERIISELLIKHPDYHLVQYAMGVICMMRKNYDAAIRYFDRAVDINPLFVEAWFNKGVAHQKKLQVSEMIRAYQEVIELGDPKDDFVRHARNFLAGLEKSVKKEAGVTLDLYLQSNDKFNDAYAAMENMEWEKALKGFQEVLAINPKHPQSYGNIGICFAALGNRQEALAAFDKALELDPKYEPALLNREIVKSLKEGEKLSVPKVKSIEYYKDYSLKKKSLLNSLFK